MKLSRTVSRRLLALLVVAALALYQYYGAAPDVPSAHSPRSPDSQATQSSAGWRAGQWVELSGTVQRLLSDDNEVQDLVQDTWVRALRSAPPTRTSLGGWFATITRNLARDRHRGRARRRAREEAAARDRKSVV